MVSSDHDLIVRIDERVKAIHDRLPEFVTRTDFDPIKRIVWVIVLAGLTSLVAGGVVVAKGG